jgi:hypothetical protein
MSTATRERMIGRAKSMSFVRDLRVAVKSGDKKQSRRDVTLSFVSPFLHAARQRSTSNLVNGPRSLVISPVRISDEKADGDRW